MRTLVTALVVCGVVSAQTPVSLGETSAKLELALEAGNVNDVVGLLAGMPGAYPKAEEADQKAAVKLIGAASKSKDLRIRHGAFAALGAIEAKGSSKYLKKWLNPPKRFKREIPTTYIEALRAAGKIADFGTLAQLQKVSKHPESTIAGEATRALGGFHKLPTKRRKNLAIELVERLELLSAPPGRRSRGGEAERMRKAALVSATKVALRGLTGKDFSTTKGWTGWKDRAEKKRDPFQ